MRFNIHKPKMYTNYGCKIAKPRATWNINLKSECSVSDKGGDEKVGKRSTSAEWKVIKSTEMNHDKRRLNK